MVGVPRISSAVHSNGTGSALTLRASFSPCQSSMMDVVLEQQKNLQSSLKDVALCRRLNQQKDFMLQQFHHLINIPCFSWRTTFLTQWIWILVRTVFSVFLYSKFHKNLTSVLFEDRKVHFALMGEEQSVQL